MGRSVVLLLAALVGCGRVGFDDRFDGGSGSDATADARIDASFTSRHWVNRGAGAPGILFAPKLVYHPIRRTVVMYGGGGGITPNIVSDEMWEWDGTTWTQLCTNCAPGGRRYHAMTYDSGRDRIVLFGGRPGGVELDDLWEWDGTTWTERTPSGTRPSGRAGALPAPRSGLVGALEPLSPERSAAATETSMGFGGPARPASTSPIPAEPGARTLPSSTVPAAPLPAGSAPKRDTSVR